MSKRESQIYLQFFKENLAVILVPGLVLGAAAGIYQAQRPAVEHLNALLEMSYSPDNVISQIQLTDQAVSYLREKNIQQGIGVSDLKTSIFKPGPLLLSIDVSGAEHSTLEQGLMKVQEVALSRYPLSVQGEVVQSFQKTPFWQWSLMGMIAGSTLGLLLSLIRAYLKHF